MFYKRGNENISFALTCSFLLNRIARELNPLLARSSRPCTVHYRSKNKLDAFFSFYRLTVYYLKKLLYASFMAEGLGFEPSHNGFRDRRATATLALSMCGGGDGTRTHTVIGPRDFKSLAATYYATPPYKGVLGTGRHP